LFILLFKFVLIRDFVIDSVSIRDFIYYWFFLFNAFYCGKRKFYWEL